MWKYLANVLIEWKGIPELRLYQFETIIWLGA